MTSQRHLLDQLQSLYLQVDNAFFGWTCEGSTECCRFGMTGREPYVTSIEALAIEQALAKRGGARAHKPALPLTPTGPKRRLPIQQRPCPLLMENGHCAVYPVRPLGCRTFYCERATPLGRVSHADVTGWVRRLQHLAAHHKAGGDHGRPLTHALEHLRFRDP